MGARFWWLHCPACGGWQKIAFDAPWKCLTHPTQNVTIKDMRYDQC